MIRPEEHLVLFPTLARPIGDGRWDARLHGVLFKPEAGSLKRSLFIRALARGAGVRHDEIAGLRLRDRLAAFLVDNKRRRRITVRIADRLVTLGPSAANGHLVGRAVFAVSKNGAGAIDYVPAPDEDPAGRFVGRVHLLAATGVSVVSDIDDTVKHSNVPDKRDLLRNTFLRPYRAIPSVSTLHRALHDAGAAFHYVSASPWQLYPVLSEFLAGAGFAPGSFHLKQVRMMDRSAFSLIASPRAFKIATIEPLLRSWPRRRFVLVGDSAELDPEIYGDLVRRYPGSVVQVLIRNITGEERASARCRAAFAGVRRDRWELLDDDADWMAAAGKIIERASSRVR